MNNIEGLVKARIWEELNDLEDYDVNVRTVCGMPSCHNSVYDDTDSYSENDIYGEIDDALGDLTNDLNAVYTPTAGEILSGPLTLTLTTTGNGTCNAVLDDVITFKIRKVSRIRSTITLHWIPSQGGR